MTNLYVELRDTNNVLLDRIENKVTNLSWEWNRLGGCGMCSFTLQENFDTALVTLLKANYVINIIIDGTTWYSGFIDSVASNVTGNTETVSVEAMGFVYALNYLILSDVTYASIEISDIVKDIIDNYVTANTLITSSSENYDDADFTPDTLTFNTSIMEAIKTLGDIPGKREWGVNADKEFFFKTRSSAIEHFFFLGEDISSYEKKLDYSKLITKAIVEGGDIAGERYQLEVNLTGALFTREKRVTYGSVTTQSVAQKLGRAVIKEFGLPKRTVKFARRTETRLEATLPVGMIAVNLKTGIPIKLDAGYKLDAGHKLDGGTEAFQLDKVTYKISSSEDTILSTIMIGVMPAELVETISQQKFLLNQVKNY